MSVCGTDLAGRYCTVRDYVTKLQVIFRPSNYPDSGRTRCLYFLELFLVCKLEAGTPSVRLVASETVQIPCKSEF